MYIRRPEGNIRYHSSGAIYFVFEIASLTGTGVHRLGSAGQLASTRDLLVSLSLTLGS